MIFKSKLAGSAVGLIFGSLVFILAVGAVSRLALEYKYQPEVDRIFQPPSEKIEQRVFKDLHYLKKNPIFASQPRTRNARRFLAEHISDELDETPVNENETNVRKLIEDCQEQKRKNEHLVFHKCVEDHSLLSSVDVQWMQPLSQFDYWSVYEDPEYKGLLITSSRGNFIKRVQFVSRATLLNASRLMQFSLIRLLKSEKTEQDYKNYWHSLDLVHSSRGLIPGMVAVAGIKWGEEVHRSYPAPLDRPFDLVGAEAYGRLSWAWVALLDLPWGQNSIEPYQSFMKPEFGLCNGVAEQPMGVLAFEDLISNSYWPLEPNYGDRIKKYKALRMQAFEICQMEEHQVLLDPDLALKMNNSPTSEINEDKFYDLGTNDDKIEAWLISNTPYIRRFIWSVLINIGAPSYLVRYEDDRYKDQPHPPESH